MEKKEEELPCVEAKVIGPFGAAAQKEGWEKEEREKGREGGKMEGRKGGKIEGKKKGKDMYACSCVLL